MVRNEEILKDILLKMNYDTSKTLNENIQEQGSADRFVDMRAMSMAGIEYSDYMKQQWNPKPLTSDQKHLLMDIAAVGAFFIPVVGPYISLGLELANAGMYYAEGDEYMTGLSLAFAMIPFSDLVLKIPAVKKLGRDGLASLIKKSRAGSNLTKTEFEVVEQIGKKVDEVKRLASTAAKTLEKLKTLLNRAKFSDIVYMMYKLSKKYPKLFSISKVAIPIGGVMYGWDKIAEIYGIDTNEVNYKPINTVENIKLVETFDKYYENNKDQVNVDVMNNILELDTIQANQLAIDILSSVK